MNKIKVAIAALLSMVLFLIGACAGEPVTSTISSTTTVTKTAPAVTQTLSASTVTSVITSIVTSTNTVTATSSSIVSTTKKTSTSSTSSQTVTTTEYTIVDGLITSMDGKVQIISHRMDYGTRPGIRAKIKNLSASKVSAEVVVEVIHTSYTEQLTEVISDLEPGETREFSIAITGYYDTSYNFIVLRTIS